MRRAGTTRGATSSELAMLRKLQKEAQERAEANDIMGRVGQKRGATPSELAMLKQAQRQSARNQAKNLRIGKRAVQRAAARKAAASRSMFGAIASRVGLGYGGGAALTQAAGVVGAGGAGAAAGPIGLAVAGAALAINSFSRHIEEAGKNARENLDTVGKVAGEFTKNNALGGVTAGLQAYAKKIGDFGDEIKYVQPLVGLPLKMMGEQVKTVTTALKVYDDTLRGLTSRGKELAGYDSRIATGAANAQVIKLLSDMREANRMGERYGALIQKQAAMDARLNEALLPIKEKIAEFVEWGMPFFEAGLKVIIELLEGVIRAFFRVDEIVGYVSPAYNVLKSELPKIAKNTEKAEDYSVLYDPFDSLLKKLDALKITPPGPDVNAEAADRKLMLPIF